MNQPGCRTRDVWGTSTPLSTDTRKRPDLDPLKVLCAFGTRPELIKFLPVLRTLRRRRGLMPVTVLTSQHTDLVKPLIELWKIRVDHDLGAMVHGQTLNSLLSRLVARFDDVLADEAPDFVLVQGDTTSALAAAQAAWHRQIPVGHIEAGLRSGARENPFPEEMNRRLITALATLHFAPTDRNVAALLSEGVARDRIILTGNPIVDAIGLIRKRQTPSPEIRDLVASLAGRRLLLLTTHRRESFGALMRGRLRVLRDFVERRADVSLVFPVHCNPAVTEVATQELGGVPNIHLVPPLHYPDFLHCLASAWLVVSDSGGVQEEAPSLGKPLLILRENTERPEVVESGVARLVGRTPQRLSDELILAEAQDSWAYRVQPIENPFGRGESARRIVDAIQAWRTEAAIQGRGAAEAS
ncbi:UDP-N-acetylglucosamine 2-epimerase [Defluviimonas aquaemixtae]|uniref:UDP-N-acetylglucosamine 2-epimerase (non-hydrolyzing) n=1 Tax=Albidovulum aquaemixtae TaxID=1542388 RepID=A0A2R8B226_9RHOB|nr:UDP-N-acetylglucosamine 2-epimerase (non-hydrolyzing) [Defluviimonas aquaemixtae]SPH16602.1 UDP-N-acetylglucosamine 2-epimerase [Defluviimonas aquaemixtae]